MFGKLCSLYLVQIQNIKINYFHLPIFVPHCSTFSYFLSSISSRKKDVISAKHILTNDKFVCTSGGIVKVNISADHRNQVRGAEDHSVSDVFPPWWS